MDVRPSDDAHAIGSDVERGMTKEAADVEGGFARLRIEPDQTVSRMTESRLEKVLVLSEERHALEAVQQGDDLGVLNSISSNGAADLPELDPPLAQHNRLISREVFV